MKGARNPRAVMIGLLVVLGALIGLPVWCGWDGKAPDPIWEERPELEDKTREALQELEPEEAR